MQTFLPYPDFQKSVECLDWRRLGKQRLEAKQIWQTNLHGGSWQKHPAVKMWKGYEEAIKHYMNLCIMEWIRRGYNNTMEIVAVGTIILPPWIEKETFHASHRSNLLRKNPDYYGQFGWKEPNNLPYEWPVK